VNLPGGWELVLIVLVIMVLFGAKRLPEASRSLGRSMRIFKAETKGLRDDDNDTATVHDTTYAPAPLSPPPATPPPAAAPPVTPAPSVVPPAAGVEQPQQRQP
jgi:sec-independent protein translocase protein TatA